jgi:hypothetical protein
VNRSTPQGYFTLQGLAKYADLSVVFLRRYLRDPDRPLPHYRMGSRILVERAAFVEWVELFRDTEINELDQIAARVAQAIA